MTASNNELFSGYDSGGYYCEMFGAPAGKLPSHTEKIRKRLGRLKAVADIGSSVPSQVVAMRLLKDFDAAREERRRIVTNPGTG